MAQRSMPLVTFLYLRLMLKCYAFVTSSAGGYAATRYNPKTVLTAGAVLWSVFTLATPSMAGNLPALMATRAVMGMGEGVAMPAISNLFARCFSHPQELAAGALRTVAGGSVSRQCEQHP